MQSQGYTEVPPTSYSDADLNMSLSYWGADLCLSRDLSVSGGLDAAQGLRRGGRDSSLAIKADDKLSYARI
jgi:hypothetical protein